MFTGIVREVGLVVSADDVGGGLRLEIEAKLTAPTIDVGGSVAVNGVCLTAETVTADRLAFHAVPETLASSALGLLASGAAVNLEPALRAGEPLGGHLVQGHVDGVGEVVSVEPEGAGLRVVVAIPSDAQRYCVEKGSITIEGVSLTIAELRGGNVALALIPHTLSETTLAQLAPGQRVNIEVDVLAKYVERLLEARIS